MSIIYNALQKTQQNRLKKFETQTSTPSKMPVRYLVWAGAGILIVSVLAITIALFSHHPKPPPVVAPKVVVVAKPVFNPEIYKNKHIVNGVYLSDQEKIALINNKFIHPGDMLDGMKVVSIESNRVIVRSADNALILPVEQS